MKLKKSINSAKDEIRMASLKGYQLHADLSHDFTQRKSANSMSMSVFDSYRAMVDKWGSEVREVFTSIFPTDLEFHKFLHPRVSHGGAIAAEHEFDYRVKSLFIRIIDLLHGLRDIQVNDLSEYIYNPTGFRLYVEDIDSFRNVRDINPELISSHLNENGRVELSENSVQIAIEKILNEPFHKKDWGGEVNDLYSANMFYCGRRISCAFLLKGNGLKAKEMQISDCGVNGDQLLRLFDSPADIFIVQYIGAIAENVIRDISMKVENLRSKGREVYYCLINGQDTARLLFAYNCEILSVK